MLEAQTGQSFITGEPGNLKDVSFLGRIQSPDPQGTVTTNSHLAIQCRKANK